MAYHIAADVPSKIGKFFSKRDDIERATLNFPHINSLALIEPGLEPETTPNFFKPWAAGQPESLAVIDSQDEILAYRERLTPPSNSVGAPFFACLVTAHVLFPATSGRVTWRRKAYG